MTIATLTITNGNTTKILIRSHDGYMVGREITKVLNDLKNDELEINNIDALIDLLTDEEGYDGAFEEINEFESKSGNENGLDFGFEFYGADYNWFVELKNETEATIYGNSCNSVEVYRV